MSSKSIFVLFCFVLADSIVKMYFVVVAWSYLSLCNPMDCSSPGSSVHEILQARILEWVAMPSSRESSWPRDWIRVSCTGRQILYHWATWEAQGVLYIPWNLPILSVQVNDFWYIYRVVQLLPQSNFRTFPSSPKGTSCLFAVTFNFYSSPGQPPTLFSVDLPPLVCSFMTGFFHLAYCFWGSYRDSMYQHFIPFVAKW